MEIINFLSETTSAIPILVVLILAVISFLYLTKILLKKEVEIEKPNYQKNENVSYALEVIDAHMKDITEMLGKINEKLDILLQKSEQTKPTETEIPKETTEDLKEIITKLDLIHKLLSTLTSEE